MTTQIGVVMDPITNIKPHKDSTLALLLEAQRRGYELVYFEPTDLFIDNGKAFGCARRITVADSANSWFTLTEPRNINLAELSWILMRQDPPVDARFVTATHILSLAEQHGAKVINSPRALREGNEKILAQWWPHLCPPTRIAADIALLREFVAEQGKTVLKPLDAMGGSSIFVVDPEDANLSVILETLTAAGTRCALAQAYLPAITAGDKRILVFDGKPFPYALARIPAAGETRGNLAAGGRGEGAEVTAQERALCAELAPRLLNMGIRFAGLDVIGDKLTEINITSPTCIREIDKIFNVNAAAELFDCLERHP
ncbi:glutathione synthase [Halorhodospira halochloris]|uniref:Glutathione synthetase n=1 Tax=Halorhodospira halochloris TaxID=1052 RepID=A0A110B487_HALHR|nr:glutathione synthase [Halorhodospira halochloris]MBK1651075.1 glutathione synthase [Halorhodospira halochloris]MCG5529434.1 glutathione synthase [Halorhodospira halochloris]BAU56411.1 glutathione synthetase [Halorhodospira halochloris]